MHSVYYQNREYSLPPRPRADGLTTRRQIAENEYEYQMNSLKAGQLDLLDKLDNEEYKGPLNRENFRNRFNYHIFPYIVYANYKDYYGDRRVSYKKVDANNVNRSTFKINYKVDQIDFTAQFEITYDEHDIFTIHVILDPERQEEPGAELIEPGSRMENSIYRQSVLNTYKELLDDKFDVSDPPPAPASSIHNNPDLGYGLHSYFSYGGKRRSRNTIRRKTGRSKNSRRSGRSRRSRRSGHSRR